MIFTYEEIFMELVKNIFFNTDKLTANTTVKISYTGKFFQDDSEAVSIHFGFGNTWENLTELPMQKTDLGFQIELELLDSNSFNFCLKNEKGLWDNNNGTNYTFAIEHPESSLAVIEEAPIARPHRLRKSYLISKKIRLAVYKIIISIPRLISGNYKRKERKVDI